MLKLVPIIIIIIITIILSPSSSSSSSSSSYFNLSKTLLSEQDFKIASSEFLSAHITDTISKTPLTIFVPDDHAFADASAAGYKTLPIQNKYFVLKCHMISYYFPPSLLPHTTNTWHLLATIGTEIMGNDEYKLNITAMVNGSVAVSNNYVQGIVTRTVYDQSPIVVYGITKLLLPKDLPDLPPQPPKTPPPPPKTADVSAASVCSFQFFAILLFFSLYFVFSVVE
ncbi:fasciclin-like arabinogalactan protein 4-like [Trifolium pratense]|uniref:Fasciclin-like arabinogalactan protein 4-like n=1 Tax=Trifolium pratense TaxID=57577 RepID=A0A2K3JRZ8_TRIPR|nr:fasciclin-like arabinogalactan protein 4-like [Trifolium pratense]